MCIDLQMANEAKTQMCELLLPKCFTVTLCDTTSLHVFIRFVSCVIFTVRYGGFNV